MRKITLLLLLLAGLIASVTTAPVPSPDPHHGGPHASSDVDEVDGLKWVSEARMRKKPMNQKSMTAKSNMSRKKANMRKQEGMMLKKSNVNDKPKMKSNGKRRKNSNNKRKQQPASKTSPGQKQTYASFAERLQAMRAQQRKEADDQRKRERDAYLAILKETGEIRDDEDKIKYNTEPTEFNPFKEEQKEQQKLLKQQSVPLVPETAGLLEEDDDDDDDYNPFDVEEEYQYEKYTREQVEKEQKRIEAERAERLRERLRDREALKWNNRRAGQTRAQERMDTGEESDAYPVRLRFVKDLNLAGRVHQRSDQEKKNHKKMNPLNPQFKARQQSYVAAWRSRMRI